VKEIKDYWPWGEANIFLPEFDDFTADSAPFLFIATVIAALAELNCEKS
jgi:hypothetical protein